MAHRDKFGRTTFGRKWERRDDADAPTARLPITLPLKLRRSEESFSVEDAAGRIVSYVYFEDEESRRPEEKWFTEAEAREIAQLIARLLTDVEETAARSTSAFIPIEDLNAENDE